MDGTPFPPPMVTDPQMEVQDAPPPPRLRVEHYTIEGGWQPDGFGGIRYQEHGKLEDLSGSISRIKTNKSDSEGNTVIPGEYDGPITITRPLPSNATPPPAPNFRARRIDITELGRLTSAGSLNWRATPYPKLSSLDPSQIGSPPVEKVFPMSSTPPLRKQNPGLPETNPLFYSSPKSGQGGMPHAEQHSPPLGNVPPPQNTTPSLPNPHSPVRERPTHPPPLSPSHANREFHDFQESTVLQSNLRLVEIALGSLDTMDLIFWNVRNTADIRPQLAVDMCGRIKIILSSLTATLNRRSRFTKEHWRLRSQTWQKKYSDRLLSLLRTLQRLSSLEERMKRSRPGLKATNRALEKLRQFETKLSDLNTRFNKLFDRLRIRQLHDMLTESISEEQRMRRSDFPTREAYKNIQMEGKAKRARLRRDYLMYRTGRLSLVT